MPEIGRFAGRDILKGQIEIPKSLNEYAYCHNNPMAYVDLNGMNEKTAKDYLKAGNEEAIGEFVEKIVGDKAIDRIKKNAIKQKVATNKGSRRITKRVIKNNRTINKVTNSKIKATNVSIGIATVGFEVDKGYVQDKNAGKSASKIKTNALVNGGYALVGIGISSLAAAGVSSAVSAGLITAAAAGPVGWVAVIAIGFV